MRIFVLSLLFLSCGQASAQEPAPEETPEQALIRITKLGFTDVDQFAAEQHPVSLSRVRRVILESIRRLPADARQTYADGVLGPGTNLDTLEKMSDTKLYASWFGHYMNSLSKQDVELMGAAEVKPLGHVLEGKDKAHVVVRTLLPRSELSTVSLVTLRRFRGRWLGTMKEGFEALIAGQVDKLITELEEEPEKQKE